MIEQNRVVFVSGETGSGNTTRIPQYILDSCRAKGKPCRIIYTEPWRVSALTTAERVALERDEKIGQKIDYHIRLASRVSSKTLLTFCTNGVLSPTLIGGDSPFATVTHFKFDGIHERDRFSDFLSIILRDCLVKFRHLMLILMSAALDIRLFVKFCNGCPVSNVHYEHGETSATPLLVARGRGCINKLQQLHNSGAGINIRDLTIGQLSIGRLVGLLEAHETACEASYSDTTHTFF